jgi:hypothetical protein
MREPPELVFHAVNTLITIARQLKILVFQESCLHFIIHRKLVADKRPVCDRTVIPLFVEFRNAQIKSFHDSILTRERAFLSDFPEA